MKCVLNVYCVSIYPQRSSHVTSLLFPSFMHTFTLIAVCMYFSSSLDRNRVTPRILHNNAINLNQCLHTRIHSSFYYSLLFIILHLLPIFSFHFSFFLLNHPIIVFFFSIENDSFFCRLRHWTNGNHYINTRRWKMCVVHSTQINISSYDMRWIIHKCFNLIGYFISFILYSFPALHFVPFFIGTRKSE